MGDELPLPTSRLIFSFTIDDDIYLTSVTPTCCGLLICCLTVKPAPGPFHFVKPPKPGLPDAQGYLGGTQNCRLISDRDVQSQVYFAPRLTEFLYFREKGYLLPQNSRFRDLPTVAASCSAAGRKKPPLTRPHLAATNGDPSIPFDSKGKAFADSFQSGQCKFSQIAYNRRPFKLLFSKDTLRDPDASSLTFQSSSLRLPIHQAGIRTT
jgi:hypothetical protein